MIDTFRKITSIAVLIAVLSAVLILSLQAPAANADNQGGCCCGKKCMSADNSTPAAADKVVIRKAKGDEIGKKAVCPVMGSPVTISKSTDVAEDKGKTYFFCCGGCPSKFKADPEKYIKK
jgi:YHS domain-containing protein